MAEEIELAEAGEAISDEDAPAGLEYWLVDDFADTLPRNGCYSVVHSVESAV